MHVLLFNTMNGVNKYILKRLLLNHIGHRGLMLRMTTIHHIGGTT